MSTKFILSRLAFLFLAALLVTASHAQCPAPAAATVTPTPAACQGQGRVIANVTNPPAGAVYQYQLQFDSTANTSVVKPWQASDTFSQVGVGSYKVYIRRVCTSAFSTVFVSANVTVTSSTTPLSITQSRALTKSSCTNGSLDVTATGGNTAVAYQYALVPSLNEPEPITNYVRPRQTNNVFTGLAAGAYFVRVYDSCGTYATANVVIDTVTESVQLAAPRSGHSFYGCDSLKFAFTVTINNRIPSVLNGSPVDPKDRFWVTYNGITDTLTNTNIFFGFYQASTGTSYTNRFDMIHNIVYPATITYGFKSACGNVYQQTVVVAKPKLKVGLLASVAISCTQRRYYISALDSVGGNSTNYYGTRLSKDGGLTWSSPNTNSYQFNDTFIIGNTYNIWLSSACDTAKTTLSVTAPTLVLGLNQFTAYSCNNNSGIYISFNSYTGNQDSIKVKVLSQPVAGAIPDSFYYYQNSSRLSYDIPPGTYTLAARDQCGLLDTTTITINPTVVAYTIAPLLSCQPSQSGFRLNVTETNYQPYAGYSYLRAIVTNTTTGQVDSFLSASYISRPTTIDVIGLSNGNYTIKVIKVRPSVGIGALPYFTCSINSTYTNTANQPLSLTQSTFTSACANGTAAVAAAVQGGGGSNQFYLDVQGSGGSWTQVAGPQSGAVFNNLLPNNVYRLRVTDVCGNGTQYSTSFSNAAPTMDYSTTSAPCPGDAFTMGVDPDPAAIYAWQKNNSPIAGATNSTYTLNPVPNVGAPVDTYKVKISYGTCDVFSVSYAVNPVLCGQPLPLSLVSFGGFVNEQSKAQLKWEVANFEAVQSFDVEYGYDGSSFKKAGTVLSNNNRFYQFTDEQRDAPVLYYRLKMMSIDGESAYSTVLKLNDKGTNASRVKVYPTIAVDKINIQYSTATEEQLSWKLVDVRGSIVRSGIFSISKGESVLTLNGLSNLADGTYILSLNNGRTMPHYEKIVIRK